jgi:drug/metabolite transporter (DMT)-like permease
VVPVGLSEFVDKNTGLLLVVSSQAFYAAMNVFVKILNKLHPPVPPLELIFVRMVRSSKSYLHERRLIWLIWAQVITYVCCTSYMLLAGVSDPWIGPKGVRLLLIFRGFSGCVVFSLPKAIIPNTFDIRFFGLFGIYFSLQYLSLSDATVITFLAPTGTAIAGALLLQEKIRRADLWAARKLFGTREYIKTNLAQ